ncbi:MAG: sugar phosphate isomerase/epimerase [bacterium]|nr:sugar phosphate isomerase/epimerase [bacterium]
MKIEQVAAITYTIREQTKTPQEIAQSMKRLRQIGFRAVQISGMGSVGEDELARILSGEGLVCCGTHEPADQLLNEPEKSIGRLKTLGCNHASYPHPSGIDLSTVDGVKTLAARLNHSGEVLHKAGITLTYHNHHIEFMRLEGRPILEIIYAETNPRYVQAELDTYWVQNGGGNPVTWCERMAGRLPQIHMKDYAVNAQRQPAFAEIGNGNLEWKNIIPAAEKSGCQWFIVEQDTCPGDPFDSLTFSFNYIKQNLLNL